MYFGIIGGGPRTTKGDKMKKLLLLSAVALIATGAGAADIKPYIEGKISENFMKLKMSDDENSQKYHDNLFQGGSIEVGAKIDQFRVGLEGYYNDKAEDTYNIPYIAYEFKSKGVFLNGYWDIPMCEKLKKIKPYIGAGIGRSWLEASGTMSMFIAVKQTKKGKDWGWNAGLGVAYALNENVDLTLGYRYEDLGKIKKDDVKIDFNNHKVSLGLRYTF